MFQAYVLDFGSEVYSWIGRECKGAARRLAAEVGLQHYNAGYKTEAFVHPYNLNEENNTPGERLDRPEWSVYGRMAEKTENVAFRRKFYDWPDPVDLKVTTADAKVHAQVINKFLRNALSFHSCLVDIILCICVIWLWAVFASLSIGKIDRAY